MLLLSVAMASCRVAVAVGTMVAIPIGGCREGLPNGLLLAAHHRDNFILRRENGAHIDTNCPIQWRSNPFTGIGNSASGSDGNKGWSAIRLAGMNHFTPSQILPTCPRTQGMVNKSEIETSKLYRHAH